MKNLVLNYDEYAEDIGLFEEFIPNNDNLSNINKNEIIDILLEELKEYDLNMPPMDDCDYNRKRKVLRGVLNTLEPQRLSDEAIRLLNQLLQSEMAEKTKYSINDFYNDNFPDINGVKIGMFQGDITTLELDVIVNAANNQMLGCFQPLHSCIDNAIHSAAGVQLRDDCFTIMNKQGNPEPTGRAKITKAYNLPSRFVIHTVGPIVRGIPGDKEEQQLLNCYIQCLELCASIPAIRSIAFCCISTGVFGYPQDQAAEIAVRGVSEWIRNHPDKLDLVLFNVFTDKDRDLYSSRLERLWKKQP